MDKEIIRRWEANKEHLMNYIKSLSYEDVDEYEKLVRILIIECLNYGCESPYDTFNSDEIVRIDHGQYQGTEIYLFHRLSYQPDTEDYYIFDNYYGSCSGCDSLQRILASINVNEPHFSDEQVDDLITLMLHMVQRMICLENLYKKEEKCGIKQLVGGF